MKRRRPRRHHAPILTGTAVSSRPRDRIIARMRTICWVLIGLAALAFSVGTVVAFAHQTFLLEPVGFWRGAVGFLLFAIALRMMDSRA
jgi:hypothetical protein